MKKCEVVSTACDFREIHAAISASLQRMQDKIELLEAKIKQLENVGDALAEALSRHHMACGVKDAWDRLAAWEEVRREQ